VHALRQTGFLRVERLGPSDVLATCPACFTGGGAALAAQFKLKLSEACENSGNHSSCGVGRVDAFTQRPEHDFPLSEFANRGHDLRRIASQPVNFDNNDGVARSGVVQERGQTWPLLAS
jgi:hypothetical protein